MSDDEFIPVSDTEILGRMQQASNTFYWFCFRSEIGSYAHAFIEFSGLMSKYVQLARAAVAKGTPLYKMNEHSGVALPAAEHDMKYLAEKLRCIFGPIIDSNPEARAVLRKTLFLEG